MLTHVGRVLKFIQKASLVIGVFSVILLIFANQFKTPEQRRDPNTMPYVEYLRLDLYNKAYKVQPKNEAHALYLNFQKATQCTLTGELCTDNPADIATNFNNSIFGLITQGTTYTFNPPASGIAWAGESLKNVGLIPDTYAQGIGFNGILPLANLWKVFRNLSYMLIVLFVMAIGFMIMFRTKINPQTVISIENSLPRIVLTLLAITFSFPIAGFLIDIMYVIMGLGISLIAQQVPRPELYGFTANFYQQGTWDLFDGVFLNGAIWKSGPAIVQFIPLSLQYLARTIAGIAAFVLITRIEFVRTILNADPAKGIPFFGEGVKAIVGPLIGVAFISLAAGLFFGYLLSIVVYMTALFIFFRILLMLISTYVKILLLIVLSPLMLLFEMVPGQDAFVGWVKNLFVMLLTFPIVGILIAMSVYITSLAQVSPTGEWLSNGEIWKPPFLYAQDSSSFTILIGISILFLIPDLVRYVREAMGIKDMPFSISPGLLLAGGAAAVGGGIGLIGQISSLKSSLYGHSAGGIFSAWKGVSEGKIGAAADDVGERMNVAKQ